MHRGTADELGGVHASPVLTEAELTRLIVGLLDRRPPEMLVHQLGRRIDNDLGVLSAVLRWLLTPDPSAALEALEQLVAEGSSAASRPASGVAVFRRNRDYWEIAYGGRAVIAPHAKGLAYLAHLLAHPGQRVWAGDLAGKECAQGERARVSVTKALKAAIDRLATVHAELAEHLATSVRRGSSCIYLPDPRQPIRWLT